MTKLNVKPTAAILMLPLLVAGCAQLERFGSYDETKFPYRLIAQDSALIPDADFTPDSKSRDATPPSCTAPAKETDEEATKRNFKCKRDKISQIKFHKFKDVSDKSIKIDKQKTAQDRNTAYLEMIDAQKNLWEYDFQIASEALNQAFTEHLIQRRIGEIKSDAFNLPILGGLVGIAASALYKASTESIGGLATGIGGLTATREYFNVEEKRDLHRNAAIGLACLKTETARLYGLSATVLNIRQSADELKDSLSLAISAVNTMSSLSGTTDPRLSLTETDRQALTVQKETIDAAQKALFLGERNLADYRDMPHRILTAANNLQANILVKGGRGEVDGATINPQIYSRFIEAAGATQKIGELRAQIAQAKAGRFVMETSPGAGKTKIPTEEMKTTTTVIIDPSTNNRKEVEETKTTPVEKNASSIQAKLVIGIQNTLNSVESLGTENEMTKVNIRIAACGTPLQTSQAP